MHKRMFVQVLLFMFLAGNRLGTVSLSQEKKRFKNNAFGHFGNRRALDLRFGTRRFETRLF